MKKLIWLFIVLFSLAAFKNLMAYDTTAARYLPLQVGNVWVYTSLFVNQPIYCQGYEKYTISGTTIINGKSYWIRQRKLIAFQHNCDSFYVGSRLFNQINFRLDSTNCNIYTPNDCLIDSLEAENGDTERVCAGMYSPARCSVISDTIFGVVKPAKTFLWTSIDALEAIMYDKDFGLTKYQLAQPNFLKYMFLKGCVINGLVYGDTSFLVGINQISLEIPKAFSLSQNYPNPFNPTTEINFGLPKSSHVTIRVFDILGKQIAVLANNELKHAGEYSVKFDGSNFASGIYIYRIETEDFVDSKKMVLIK